MLDSYQQLENPDIERPMSKRERRAQRDAERLQAAVARMHFHELTAGEHTGQWTSHTHDQDEPGHSHPGRQVVAGRVDGGYWKETGPSMGSKTPASVAANAAKTIEMLTRMPATPDYQLMRWRLRLYCGHVVERTAHRDHKTIGAAFISRACPECGLDPATIVAARALGPAGQPPTQRLSAERDAAGTKALRRQLAKAEAEVERLRAELNRATTAPT